MAQAKKSEFPTPREQAIEAVKSLYAEGRIDEFDRDTRLDYLLGKDEDWVPGSSAAVDAHQRRRTDIEQQNRRDGVV